tara:strand:- start:162 stop:515 length:354 start_codon:yes stop_codon:yes gene_type:complete
MSDQKSNKSLTSTLSIKDNPNFLTTLITTFTAVFVAELGDKTQVATLLLTAETGKPFIVFIAAALALILSSLIGVLLGQFLSKIIDPSIYRWASSFIMISISIYIFIDIYFALSISS